MILPRIHQVATKRLFGLVAVVLILTLASPELASAAPPHIHHRARTATFVEHVFQRWLFLAWLGEPLAIAGIRGCPQDQVTAALQDRSRFPDSLKAPRGSESPYCRPSSVRFGDREKRSFTVLVPIVAACADYAARWAALLRNGTLEEALLPYELRDVTYDKYLVPEVARSIYRVTSGGRSYQKPGMSIERLRRVQLSKFTEKNGLCLFDFIQHDKEEP